MSQAPKRKVDPKEIPRTWMSRAYVEEVENGTFQMFRDVLVETDQKDFDGAPLREKMGKRIGPMFTFRVAQEGERADFMTNRPDGTVLMLVKIT